MEKPLIKESLYIGASGKPICLCDLIQALQRELS